MGNLCGKSESPKKSTPQTNKGKNPTTAPRQQTTNNQTTKPQTTNNQGQRKNSKGKENQPPPQNQNQQIIKDKGREPQDEVETADDLKAQEFRKKADEHAKSRGKYFEESQAAFKRGDKAEAKTLSDKGKAEAEKMKEANKQASDIVFKSKNRSQPPDSIDLHLLYVDEAVERTAARLEQVRKQKGDHLIVIHGAGHHSKDNKQLIKPAVVKMLNEKGIKFKENTPNSGCIYVEL